MPCDWNRKPARAGGDAARWPLGYSATDPRALRPTLASPPPAPSAAATRRPSSGPPPWGRHRHVRAPRPSPQSAAQRRSSRVPAVAMPGAGRARRLLHPCPQPPEEPPAPEVRHGAPRLPSSRGPPWGVGVASEPAPGAGNEGQCGEAGEEPLLADCAPGWRRSGCSEGKRTPAGAPGPAPRAAAPQAAVTGGAVKPIPLAAALGGAGRAGMAPGSELGSCPSRTGSCELPVGAARARPRFTPWRRKRSWGPMAGKLPGGGLQDGGLGVLVQLAPRSLRGRAQALHSRSAVFALTAELPGSPFWTVSVR